MKMYNAEIPVQTKMNSALEVLSRSHVVLEMGNTVLQDTIILYSRSIIH